MGVTCSLQAMGSEICSYIHTLTRVHIVRVNRTTNWHSRPLIVEDFVQLQIFKYIYIYFVKEANKSVQIDIYIYI